MTVFFHMSYKLNIYVKRFLSDDPTARFGSDFFCRGSKIILLLFMQFRLWLLTVTTDIMKENVVWFFQNEKIKVLSPRLRIVFKSFIQKALYFAKFMFNVSLFFQYCANVLSFSFLKAYNGKRVSEQLRSLIDSFPLQNERILA